MQRLIPSGGENKVYTPHALAKSIVDHYKPSGIILDPCRGKGAFYDNFPSVENKLWCEIDDGIDFLNNFDQKVDWVITNPPWGKPFFRQFLRHSMKLSDNVVFLCLINAFFQNARLDDLEEFGFTIKEILYIPKSLCPSTEEGWPSLGMSMGAIHICKSYDGDIKFSKMRINA